MNTNKEFLEGVLFGIKNFYGGGFVVRYFDELPFSLHNPYFFYVTETDKQKFYAWSEGLFFIKDMKKISKR